MSAISNLWADYIIMGEREFSEVPSKLIEDVKKSLTEKGHPELIPE